MFEWVRAVHDAFNVDSTWAFSLVIAGAFAVVLGVGGGTVAFIVDKAYRKAEGLVAWLAGVCEAR